MKSIIFDSSVWIDHFNRKYTPQAILLSKLLLSKQRVCITPIIAQEILQGIKSDNLFDVCEMVLSGQYLLSMDAWEAAVQSANLYRTLRKKESLSAKPTTALSLLTPSTSRLSFAIMTAILTSLQHISH